MRHRCRGRWPLAGACWRHGRSPREPPYLADLVAL